MKGFPAPHQSFLSNPKDRKYFGTRETETDKGKRQKEHRAALNGDVTDVAVKYQDMEANTAVRIF